MTTITRHGPAASRAFDELVHQLRTSQAMRDSVTAIGIDSFAEKLLAADSSVRSEFGVAAPLAAYLRSVIRSSRGTSDRQTAAAAELEAILTGLRQGSLAARMLVELQGADALAARLVADASVRAEFATPAVLAAFLAARMRETAGVPEPKVPQSAALAAAPPVAVPAQPTAPTPRTLVAATPAAATSSAARAATPTPPAASRKPTVPPAGERMSLDEFLRRAGARARRGAEPIHGESIVAAAQREQATYFARVNDRRTLSGLGLRPNDGNGPITVDRARAERVLREVDEDLLLILNA